MKRGKPFSITIVLVTFTLYLAGCAGNTPTPAIAAVAPTTTALPPTDTPVPATATAIPPTATAVPTDTPTNTPVLPTLTATPIPPTATATATLTPKPPPPPTAIPKFFTVSWKKIDYNNRTGDSFWCQLHNQYQNLTTEGMPFNNEQTVKNYFFINGELGRVAGYEPLVGVANSDGTINRWTLAGWYAKALGWSNGIEQFPPGELKPGLSDDWTWYSVSRTGQYCRYVYVKWKGKISAAEFAPNGEVVNSNAKLPAGAP